MRNSVATALFVLLLSGMAGAEERGDIGYRDLLVPVGFQAGDVDWPCDAMALGLELGDIADEKLEDIGLAKGDAFWVLPGRGAAVPATFVRARFGCINECSGDMGVVVTIQATLPDGEPALAVWHGTPPASWKQPKAMPTTCDESCARGKLEAKAREQAEEHTPSVSHLVWTGEHWSGLAVWELPKPPNPEPEDWTYDMDVWRMALEVTVSADGKLTVVKEERRDGATLTTTAGARDIDGDGKPDLAISEECVQYLSLSSGKTVRSGDRCCGC